jgi:diguanylate cyclase (GGDEF)-like protein
MNQRHPEADSAADPLPHHIMTDPLTGLLTPRGFGEQRVAMFKGARADEHFSIAILDIDDLMSINDDHGHAAGDVAIKLVAKVLKEHAGEGTITGRIGGDVFAVLFPNTGREQAFLTLERIRAEIDRCQELEMSSTVKLDVDLTISGGLASYPVDGRSLREVWRQAEQAVYRASNSGKNTILLARDERKVTKTAHFTPTQLERLAELSEDIEVGEAELLREALDDLLNKYDAEYRRSYKGLL